MEELKKQFVTFCLEFDVLSFGEFTLKSGRISPYFFNFGRFNTGDALKRLGEFYAKVIVERKVNFDQLFGPAYKGIPLVSSIVIALKSLYKQDVPYSFNRKEAKDHGEGGHIVGAPLSGNIIIVDDVITKGTAFNESLTLFKSYNVQPCALMIALDRQELGPKGQSAIADIQNEHHIDVFSIISFTDILDSMDQFNLDANIQAKMLAYQKQYGVSVYTHRA